jgi:hypothetical protein
MGEIHRARGFKVDVQMDEIARVLGYGFKGIPERVAKILDQIEKSADDLLSTAYCYCFLSNEEFAHSDHLKCVSDIVVCLVTIGHRLENAVDEYKLADELSHAVILDTYGSAAAEAAADVAEADIRKEITGMGLKCSTRFSPGYGDWDVGEQKWIVPALEGKTIGVYLTEGCMMAPRKSITFAMTYGEEVVELHDGNMCDACDMEKCRFRRTG